MSGYALLYRRAREQLETEAEQRLGRALTTHERNVFRSCGTLTRLEELGMTVYYAADAAELAATLNATSFEARYALAVDEQTHDLERLLHRALTAAERGAMQQLGNIEALWELVRRVAEVPTPAREHAFTAALHSLRQPTA